MPTKGTVSSWTNQTQVSPNRAPSIRVPAVDWTNEAGSGRTPGSLPWNMCRKRVSAGKEGSSMDSRYCAGSSSATGLIRLATGAVDSWELSGRSSVTVKACPPGVKLVITLFVTCGRPASVRLKRLKRPVCFEVARSYTTMTSGLSQRMERLTSVLSMAAFCGEVPGRL